MLIIFFLIGFDWILNSKDKNKASSSFDKMNSIFKSNTWRDIFDTFAANDEVYTSDRSNNIVNTNKWLSEARHREFERFIHCWII